MKKILFSLLTLVFLSSCTLADCSCNKKIEQNKNTNIQCEEEKTCDKCAIEDDEYCTYNQCFCDKQFKKLKKELCLTSNQECALDKLYKNFKDDMENFHTKYRIEKNKLLEMIECDNDCYKEQIKVVKDIKKDTKCRCKEFKKEIKEQLCKNQYKDYNRFMRHQKSKMKKLCKYSSIHKLPCVDCCK